MADPIFDALWKRVIDRWEDERAHAELLQHAQVTEQLAEAASRYAAARADPNRAAVAEKRIEAVSLLATSALLADRADRLPTLPRWFTFALAVALSATVGFVLLRALR